MQFEIEKMTMAELEQIEEKSGKSVMKLLAGGELDAKTMRAIAWIAKRRENPEFTWEDSGELTLDFLTVDED